MDGRFDSCPKVYFLSHSVSQQDVRKFWFHWGNPVARYIRKSINGEKSEIRKEARGNVKASLKKVNIDSSEEQIDEILTEVFDLENKSIPWYIFD